VTLPLVPGARWRCGPRFAPGAERSAVMWVESTATIGSRLVPASAAIPTAAADQQHNDDNDQKCLGIHIALLGMKRGLINSAPRP